MTIRVAMITPFPEPGVEPTNGVEVAAFRLAMGLAARDVDVTVVTHGDVPTVEERDGVHVRRVEFDNVHTLAHRYRPWRAKVCQALTEIEPEITHGQGLLYGALPAGDYDAPRIATAHGAPYWDALGLGAQLGARARGVAAAGLAQSATRRLDALISVHPDPYLHLPFRLPKFHFIPNIAGAPPLDLPDREPLRILYCGGARWLKGWDRLRAAWPIIKSIVPGATLHVAGWPAGVDLGLPAAPGLEVQGLISPTDVVRATARASVVVLPSRFEVAPVVLTDAWSVGTPVVASRAGGIPGLATGAAVLANAVSPAELAGSIVRCLLDPAASAPLISEGCRRIAAMSEVVVVEAHIALYRSLISRTGDQPTSRRASV